MGLGRVQLRRRRRRGRDWRHSPPAATMGSITAPPPCRDPRECWKLFSPPEFRVYCQGRAQDGKRGPERKGDARVGGRRGCEVLAMAANALSFLVGIVLPLGGALWLVLH